jgi:hypothetical protein
VISDKSLMPTQTEAPRPARVKVTSTVIRENLPDAPSGREAYPEKFYDREFWEVIHTLTPEQWRSHLCRVYSADDRWVQSAGLENNKLQEDFDEDVIRARWGGGRFILWLFGPPLSSAGNPATMVMAPFRLELEGPRRQGSAAPTAVGNGGPSSDANLTFLLSEMMKELRELRGGDMAKEAMRQSLDIMSTAYKSAVASVHQATPAAPSVTDEIELQLRRAMLERFLNPPDPAAGLNSMVTLFTAAAGALKTMTGGLGLGAGKPDIIGSILEKLPTLMDKGLEGFKEYRMASEAQERSLKMQIQSQGSRVIDAQPVATQTAGTEPAAAAPQAATQAGNQVPPGKPPVREVTEVTPPSDEWILLRLVEIIEKTDDTGEEVVQFLHYMAPGILNQLSVMSRDSILGLFATNPILARVSTHSRLPKLIDEVLATLKPNPAAN